MSNKNKKYNKNEQTGLIFCHVCNDWFNENHFYIYKRATRKNPESLLIACKFKYNKNYGQVKEKKTISHKKLDNGNIYCGHCKQEFGQEHFSVFTYNRFGKEISQYCCKISDKRFAINKENNKYDSKFIENPGLYKIDIDLQRDYGITLDDYNKLFENQNGCCAICGRHQIEFKKRLFVDHNHDTGAVRGLLCNTCNGGIGLLKDSKEIVKNALSYLEKYN